ncbi:DUF3577 domain-containing protein [Xanthomonas citri pv. citri]|nr:MULTISPECIES: DUF3577 domain-containing protein [Xanthomonas]AGH77723.1 hypothetical protein XAC29_11320 [Xanthomonas axonopodis Xac29-1]AJD68825.1 hypothetical protein J151_02401 [Xanthomonas citri subsp. citri A306]AJY82351.1 Protein of unknown function (DUF3577) [Xanthomonas citri pv. citri]AJY86775.1 Protein of unknown function (DUF3577) [Xanthomonas citri subsp. citri UI6]AJY91206.1 Protein of unknown function (DUF3577) [Xanthomonas citri pv. citri]
MNTPSPTKSYFDLHTSGIGYLQDVREVPVRGGRRAQPFLACKIAALVGSANDPGYRYFDMRVSGAEAKKLVERYLGENDRRSRPLVRFRIGDIWPDAYLRTSGERKGEAAASIKGRLLKAELIDRAEFNAIETHEIITRGIGYLNRPEDVRPKDSDPFLSCSIAALAGPVDQPAYRYIETRVDTEEACHLVRRCIQAVESDRKVLIAFRLNDMTIDPYIRTKGEHAGEPAAGLESNLVHIGLIKIDGQKVYPAGEPDRGASPDQQAPGSDNADAPTTDDHATGPATCEPDGEAREREPALADSY